MEKFRSFAANTQAGKINLGYFCRNWLISIVYPNKKPGCHFAPFAFPMKTGMSLRSICNFAYLLNRSLPVSIGKAMDSRSHPGFGAAPVFL